MKRRNFLRQSSMVSLGFVGLHSFVSSCASNPKEIASFPTALSEGYGPLLKDPEGILMLPQGFSYQIISRQGDQMIDGFFVPGLADGMATFSAPDGRTIVVRNHEVSPGNPEQGAFGKELELLPNLLSQQLYDYGRGELPCLGGTTTFVYNGATGKIEEQYLSLAGTIRNCAGGPTPWGSWISCEENTATANDQLEKNHGYNFEVPASVSQQLVDPLPLKAMGRFNHEAVCVDSRTGIVYQTEDRGDGLIYRFIPEVPGELHKGGRLQALAIQGMHSFDTRNWAKLSTERMEIGMPYTVEWVDLNEVESPNDDLRLQGFEAGAARFARGEGMWYGEGEIYFACTNGGVKEHGQIFKYTPGPNEGKPNESQAPGTLALFVEPNNTDIVESCDNLTVSPHGGVVLCEDKGTPRIIGLKPNGEMYHIAKNVGFQSEFAGVCFSPDGETLFVNIQGPGLTLAITGPWGSVEA